MRVLAIANGHALAHISRLLEVSKVLRARGHEVIFAAHGAYRDIPGRDGFSTHELPYIPLEQALRAVRTGRLWEIYRRAQLETYIEAELALYGEIQPDLVLIDDRPTARISAEQAGLPTVAVLNTHMSNHRRIPFYSFAGVLGRPLPPGLGWTDRVENTIEGVAYDRVVMGSLNRLRRKLGLARLFAYEHDAGELTLLADVPELSPVVPLPPNVRLVGPLPWHNGLPPPRCLNHLVADRRAVYFALGSASLGADDPLERAAFFGELSRSGVQVVASSGRTDGEEEQVTLPQGVFVESFINTEHLLPRCDLVCCHGGNGTLYQALSHGLPIVVVATHAEQHYGGKRIEQLGLGRAMTLATLRRRGMAFLAAVIRDVLGTPAYRQNAERFAEILKPWDGPALAADAIEEHLRASR